MRSKFWLAYWSAGRLQNIRLFLPKWYLQKEPNKKSWQNLIKGERNRAILVAKLDNIYIAEVNNQGRLRIYDREPYWFNYKEVTYKQIQQAYFELVHHSSWQDEANKKIRELTIKPIPPKAR